MEIKVGMWLRKSIKIGKVIEVCDCEYCNERGFFEPTIQYNNKEIDYITIYDKPYITYSFNIIDLIEVGDYVEVEFEDGEQGVFQTMNNKEIAIYDYDNCLQYLSLNEVKILSIVTKEQFEIAKLIL